MIGFYKAAKFAYRHTWRSAHHGQPYTRGSIVTAFVDGIAVFVRVEDWVVLAAYVVCLALLLWS